MSPVERRLLVVAGFATLAGGVFWHDQADACVTLLPPASLVGLPANGDTEVPTDVVPFYASLRAPPGQGSFVLISSGGDQVAVAAATRDPSTIELTPQNQLLPNTQYTLRGTWTTSSGENVVLELGFTTGPGPLSSPPAPPSAFLQHYAFEGSLTSCSPPRTGTCVALPAGVVVGATELDAIGQAPFGEYLHRGPFFVNLSGIDQGTPSTCIRLRTRALNATYSDPVTLCGAGAPLVRLDGDQKIACTPDGFTHDGPVAKDDASAAGGGCQVAAPRHTSAAWALTLLALIPAMRRLTRRRCR
jgi:hypothetical protein